MATAQQTTLQKTVLPAVSSQCQWMSDLTLGPDPSRKAKGSPSVLEMDDLVITSNYHRHPSSQSFNHNHVTVWFPTKRLARFSKHRIVKMFVMALDYCKWCPFIVTWHFITIWMTLEEMPFCTLPHKKTHSNLERLFTPFQNFVLSFKHLSNLICSLISELRHKNTTDD